MFLVTFLSVLIYSVPSHVYTSEQGASAGPVLLRIPEVALGERADAGVAPPEALEADEHAVGVHRKHLNADARVAHPARALLRRRHPPLHQLQHGQKERLCECYICSSHLGLME